MSNFSDLAFFIELARQPSLAAAAQVLGVTAPNVSRRLAALERRLGVRLLNRTTRRKLKQAMHLVTTTGTPSAMATLLSMSPNFLPSSRTTPSGGSRGT